MCHRSTVVVHNPAFFVVDPIRLAAAHLAAWKAKEDLDGGVGEGKDRLRRRVGAQIRWRPCRRGAAPGRVQVIRQSCLLLRGIS